MIPSCVRMTIWAYLLAFLEVIKRKHSLLRCFGLKPARSTKCSACAHDTPIMYRQLMSQRNHAQ